MNGTFVPAWVLANAGYGVTRVMPARCMRCGQTDGNWSMAGHEKDDDVYWQCMACGRLRVMTRAYVLRRLRALR